MNSTLYRVADDAEALELAWHIGLHHHEVIVTLIILVTHDLGLAAEFCQTLAVMYAGRIVEKGPTDVVVENPRHPYTQGLLACIPRIGGERQKLSPIPGSVPDLIGLPPGCAFRPRCSLAQEGCLGHNIPLREVEPGHLVRCILHAGAH